MAFTTFPPYTKTKPVGPLQINPGHPLAKDLLTFIPFMEAGGLHVADICKPIRNGLLPASGVNWSGGTYGSELQFGGASGNFVDLGTYAVGFADANTFTYEFIIKTGTSVVATQTVYSGNNTASTMIFDLSSSVGFRAIINGTAISATSLLPAANTEYHVVYTRAGSGAGGKFWINGIAQALGTNNSNAFADTSTNHFIGQRVTNTEMWTGRIRKFAIYNRVLLPTEIQRLYAEPWSMLQNQPSLRLDQVSAAAATNSNFFAFF